MRSDFFELFCCQCIYSKMIWRNQIWIVCIYMCESFGHRQQDYLKKSDPKYYLLTSTKTIGTLTDEWRISPLRIRFAFSMNHLGQLQVLEKVKTTKITCFWSFQSFLKRFVVPENVWTMFNMLVYRYPKLRPLQVSKAKRLTQKKNIPAQVLQQPCPLSTPKVHVHVVFIKIDTILVERHLYIWCVMWWNTQYIIRGNILSIYEGIRPQHSQANLFFLPKNWNFFMKK